MESSQSQYKANYGVEVEAKVANPRSSVRSSDFLLRLLAVVTTLVAAIIIGVARETKMVPFSLLSNVPPSYIPLTAKSHYSSAFVFFTVSNAIACAYAALSLLLLIAKRARGNAITLATTIISLDVIMVGLLFSGNGAAAAIGLLGYQGNSHANWQKVCNVFGTYCHQVAASIGVSLLGSLLFVLLVLLAVLNLHKTNTS
ncbi:PREDICTED: CASP-like protein 1E1 [Nelumbo nucifera]|uniref:CASP-like protein n=2 Tax=Nelumbo nucifera TaxID=4432 RepID=A0A1U7YQW4_NELNU|nr:PREDICTED: CASP-like protein 1E1 [Nelumbo nucifera]DAD33432.1 TPA_asm: hypothetical protein HUJ06_012283 [Nelumbo nucifera]